MADATLVAPVDGIVRTRVMEPGEMASPQRPVVVLAITDPKWVRAYVNETDLGRVREGTTASIVIDSFPDRRFDGWIGFISPVAEFTPKNVQTEELRTSLVYEVRVFAKDPENRLHLGMPATVHLALDEKVAAFDRADGASVGVGDSAMSGSDSHEFVLVGRNLRKTFQRKTGERVDALDDVSLSVRRGSLTAIVGPDGAGKTTLLRLATGLLRPDSGELIVLDTNVVDDPQAVQDRVGYMPQQFGLYEDLSVRENLDLYADLSGVTLAQRRQRYPELMSMTALAPFVDRLAGKLSGGMKQKLGLACTLVRSPDLLLLDEPTVGVDPLSRRELWEIILRLVNEQQLTVVITTSYLDEADRCARAIVLQKGRVLADGAPAEIRQMAAERTFLWQPAAGRTARGMQAQLLHQRGVVDAVPEGGHVRFVVDDPKSELELREMIGDAQVTAASPRFEDGFMVLLHRSGTVEHVAASIELVRPAETNGDEGVVECQDLVRKFGAFTAVDHVSFAVKRGEVFGLLGPNGAGKTTTFRMLCGLLAASGGTLRVAGVDLRTARASARSRIGYVAQKFSLYGQLSVVENLNFFARAYGLSGKRRSDRIRWAIEQFELEAAEMVAWRAAPRRLQATPGHGRGADARAGYRLSGRANQRRRSACAS